MNSVRERYKKNTKITDATDTLKYTIRNGLIKSNKTSTNKKYNASNETIQTISTADIINKQLKLKELKYIPPTKEAVQISLLIISV